jgi:hypothetical protein
MYKGIVVLYTISDSGPTMSHTNAITVEDKVIYLTLSKGIQHNNGLMDRPVASFYANPRELTELEKIVFDIDKLLESVKLK